MALSKPCLVYLDQDPDGYNIQVAGVDLQSKDGILLRDERPAPVVINNATVGSITPSEGGMWRITLPGIEQVQ